MAHDDPRSHLPLTPIVLHILIALGNDERHGYAISQEIETKFCGEIKVGPGSMYGSVQRMLAAKLIEEVDPRSRNDGDARRRYYRVTPLGREVRRLELERLDLLLEWARARKATHRTRLA